MSKYQYNSTFFQPLNPVKYSGANITELLAKLPFPIKPYKWFILDFVHSTGSDNLYLVITLKTINNALEAVSAITSVDGAIALKMENSV